MRGLPAALAHKGMILGDPPRRAENEPPGEFGGVFVAATRAAGAAYRDAARLERLHVERRVAHAGGDQELQLWQPVDHALGECGALAHRADNLAIGKRAHDIVLIGEREALDRDLDAARPNRRPIRHVERDALVIVKDADAHRRSLRFGFAR